MHIIIGFNRTVNHESQLSCKAFKDHPIARQLWNKPQVDLNKVQQNAAMLAFRNPFQLIQGPPGET